MLLGSSWVKEESTREIRNSFNFYDNKNTTYQNFVGHRKGIFRALSIYVRKEDRHNVSYLSFYLHKLEKEVQCTQILEGKNFLLNLCLNPTKSRNQ